MEEMKRSKVGSIVSVFCFVIRLDPIAVAERSSSQYKTPSQKTRVREQHYGKSKTLNLQAEG